MVHVPHKAMTQGGKGGPEGLRTPAGAARALARAFPSVLDALLPRRCAATDVPLAEGELSATALDTLLPAPPGSGAPWLYGGALQQALVRAKFEPDEGRARALARLWVRAIAEGEVPPPFPRDFPCAAVTFVPAHWRRRLRRGFDLPPLLAAALAAHYRLPVVDVLVCVRHDPPLSAGLDREARQARSTGRYRLRRAPPGPLLLVDDVITTGATLAAAAAPLSAAGVPVVQAALAMTPTPGSL